MTPVRDDLSEKVDAIFFDCDGVLLDSVHIKERQFRAIIRERIPSHVDAAMDYYWRNGGTSRLAKFRWIWAHLVGAPLSDAAVASLGREMRERVFAGVVACPMLTGAQEFLDAHAGLVPCFVISGTPDEELKGVIEARGLTKFFREVRGSPATKTEIGGELLRRHGLAPERVWFVGDATTDLEAARNLGVHFVGIDGPHLTPFVGQGEHLIKDLSGLEQAIRESA